MLPNAARTPSVQLKQRRCACLSRGARHTRAGAVKYWRVGSILKRWGCVDKAGKAVARDQRRRLTSILLDRMTHARVR